MKSFEELSKQNTLDLVKIESVFSHQSEFEKLSKEEKVDYFKEYLFLQAKMDKRLPEDRHQELYNNISSGKNGLEEVLNAISENVKDGGDCIEELRSPFMKDSCLSRYIGILDNDNIDIRGQDGDLLREGNASKNHR